MLRSLQFELEFEVAKAILHLIGGNPAALDFSVFQSLIVERNFAGSGFSVNLTKSPLLAFPTSEKRVCTDSIHAVVNNQLAVMFMAFCDDGFMDFFEGCTYGKLWPQPIDAFQIFTVAEINAFFRRQK